MDYKIFSEEIVDFMEQPPRSVLKWGTGAIVSVIIIALLISWFVKYPDIIQAKVIITTQNPPSGVVAHATGKIDYLAVTDKQTVQKNDLLAIIENPANYTHITKLNQTLSAIGPFFINFDTVYFAYIQPELLQLGELEGNYAQFINQFTGYRDFIRLNNYPQKIKAIEEQISLQQKYYTGLARQISLQETNLKLAQKQFQRDSQLYKQNVIAEAEFEKASNTWLQYRISFETATNNLKNHEAQIAQLKQQLTETGIQFSAELQKQRTQLSASYRLLDAQIKNWEQTWLLRAPQTGKITFTKVWSKNQNIKAGETVFSIIPDNAGKIIGRAEFPVTGSGKVKNSQLVNIKLINYPYNEFGMIRGTIQNISLIPQENNYMAEIELPDSLVTTYNKKLPFVQELQGIADIVTDDRRLIERFIDPVKNLVKNN